MPYATTTDMQNRYPNRDLVQLTNEDPTQAMVNVAFLSTFLNDASDEIDAYLEARFALPLSDPPSILTRLCCEIAMYHMNSLRPIHDLQDTKDKYEKAISLLKEVSDGKRTLGLNTDSEEAADFSSPAVVTELNIGGDSQLPQRIFTRGKLKGF